MLDWRRLSILAIALVATSARGDELPSIEHQPTGCTVAGAPFTLCARVTDDVQVARTSVYFKRVGETWFSYVLANFDGVNFCATLPAPRASRAAIEYYVQAVDSSYQTRRSSSFLLQVQSDDQCGFAPVEKDPAKTGAIVVYAVHPKQKRLSEAFAETGVRFVLAGPHK